MAHARDTDGTMRYFSLSNPVGLGQGDVPSLLKSLATTIEELGAVQIYDITFHSEPTADEDNITFTVYYDRPARH